MLHLIPAPLHRALYRLADRVRRVWWRIAKPRRHSAFVVAFDEAGRVLLVRHSYGPPVWTVPGGGIRRGEEPAAAAARELREELACEAAELVAIETHEARDSGARDLRRVFVARLAAEPVADQREVVAVQWADPAELPAACSRHAERFIARALAARSQQG